MATDFQKKKKSGYLHYIAIAGAAMAVLVLGIMLVIANINIYHRKQQLDARIQSLKAEITDLQKENTGIQQGIDNATNSAYVEQVAREQLDLQKPGETVVSFVQTPSENKSQQ